MKFKRWLLVFCFTAASIASAQEQTGAQQVPLREPPEEAQVRALIEGSGLLMVAAQRFAESITARELEQLTFTTPDDELRAKAALYQESKTIFEAAARAPNGLMDRIVPVYQRYLSKREVAVLIEFYELNLGAKLNSTGGIIADQLRRLAEAWSNPQQEAFKAKLLQALQREGIAFQAK